MTTPVLTEDGKRLAEALVKADHEFKAHPTVFHPARRGDKTFEFRKDDRGGYHVGQTVCLRCYASETGYTDDAPLYRVITDLLRPGEFGLQDGYCILSLRPLNTAAASLRLPLEGDAGLREALRDVEGKCELARSIYQGEPTATPEHVARCFAVIRDFARVALASTTLPAEAKTPDAEVGEMRDRAYTKCPECAGSGSWEVFGEERDCDTCSGLGSVEATPTGSAGEDDTGVREALAADVLHYIQSSENGLSRVPRQFLCRIEDVLRSGCAPQPPKAETPAGVGDDAFRTWFGRTSLGQGDRGFAASCFHAGYIAALSDAPAARPGDGVGLTLTELHAANIARQAEWCPDQVPDLSFRGNELAGETGEACNVIKKLERERQGWRGSRATLNDLAEELADVVICADLCAVTAGIDLGAAVVAKFNATSDKVGISVRLAAAPAADGGR